MTTCITSECMRPRNFKTFSEPDVVQRTFTFPSENLRNSLFYWGKSEDSHTGHRHMLLEEERIPIEDAREHQMQEKTLTEKRTWRPSHRRQERQKQLISNRSRVARLNEKTNRSSRTLAENNFGPIKDHVSKSHNKLHHSLAQKNRDRISRTTGPKTRNIF